MIPTELNIKHFNNNPNLILPPKKEKCSPIRANCEKIRPIHLTIKNENW